MQEGFKDKYFKEGIVDDRNESIILSRNLNRTSMGILKKRGRIRKDSAFFLDKHNSFDGNLRGKSESRPLKQ